MSPAKNMNEASLRRTRKLQTMEGLMKAFSLLLFEDRISSAQVCDATKV